MGDHPVIMGPVGAEVTDFRSVSCLGPLECAVSLPPHLLPSPHCSSSHCGALQTGPHSCPRAFALTPPSQQPPPPIDHAGLYFGRKGFAT